MVHDLARIYGVEEELPGGRPPISFFSKALVAAALVAAAAIVLF